MLKEKTLPKWSPKTLPIYDIQKTYLENLKKGPCFVGEIPKRPEVSMLYDFLGTPVASPLGVPAGPLLDSKWTTLAAQLGLILLPTRPFARNLITAILYRICAM